MQTVTTCTKRFGDVPFAHRQPAHRGHCRHVHGHNWAFEFEFACREKDECGFVVDFGGLGQVKTWLAQFDHALVLNESDPLVEKPALESVLELTGRNLLLVPDCSCEGLAELALAKVGEVVAAMTQGRAWVARCTVFEDSKNSATCEVAK